MDIPQAQKDATLGQILEGLDRTESELREVIAHPQPFVRRGKVVTSPATGEPVPDLRRIQAAEKELAAVLKQRDELLGFE